MRNVALLVYRVQVRVVIVSAISVNLSVLGLGQVFDACVWLGRVWVCRLMAFF